MYYNMLLDKTEAIDILHLKIARAMKKLLIICNRFLSSRHVTKYGQCLIANSFIKYKHKLTNNVSFSSV